MRIVNLTHGSFYLLGAYLGLAVIERTGSFLLALIIAPLCVAVLALLMHRFLLRRFQHVELAQVLLTFGVLFICADFTLWQWGGYSYVLPKPAFLAASLTFGSIVFPVYRLFVIATGVAVALDSGSCWNGRPLGAWYGLGWTMRRWCVGWGSTRPSSSPRSLRWEPSSPP